MSVISLPSRSKANSLLKPRKTLCGISDNLLETKPKDSSCSFRGSSESSCISLILLWDIWRCFITAPSKRKSFGRTPWKEKRRIRYKCCMNGTGLYFGKLGNSGVIYEVPYSGREVIVFEQYFVVSFTVSEYETMYFDKCRLLHYFISGEKRIKVCVYKNIQFMIFKLMKHYPT